jgi:hypothetical protein
MQAPWIFSSTFLPHIGEPIDFLLDDRSQPIHGTFLDGVFHSRWADYGTDRVSSWRGSDPDLPAPSIEPPVAIRKTTLLATLRRIANGNFGPFAADPIVVARRRPRTDRISLIATLPPDPGT